MRLQASFGAVGIVALLALTEADWGRAVERTSADGQHGVGRCVSDVRLVETVKTYEFFGARADAASRSLRQRLLVTSDYEGREKRFTGQTDWHIEWRACFETRIGRCRISGVVSSVNVTYTLPEWVDRRFASPDLRARWDRYIASLAEHEKGHGRVAAHVAKLIDEAIVGMESTAGCEALGQDAARVVDEVMQRGEALQRYYDRTTSHGSAQGAEFPF